MPENKALTVDEIETLVRTWFQALNDKWLLVNFLPMLAPEGLEMKFPEATLHNYEEFERWHHDVTHTFFDQDHIIHEIASTIQGDTADLKIQVTWKAQTWEAPAARSKHLAMDAHQSWTVRRLAKTGRPVIAYYSVDKIEPHDGNGA